MPGARNYDKKVHLITPDWVKNVKLLYKYFLSVPYREYV